MIFIFSSKKSQKALENVIPSRIARISVKNSRIFVLILFVTVLSLSIKNETEQNSLKQLASGHAEPYTQLLNIPRKVPYEKDRQLEFVHITKTGGSAIEHAASEAGVNWGVCHYQVNEMVGCHHPDFINSNLFNLNTSRFANLQAPWHVPLQYFVDNPFKNSPTFAVVRNPYDRYVSEYYCPWGGFNGPKENKDDPQVMNAYLQERIPREIDVHYLPQHYYVYNEGKRMVDHVLHFENLNSEFAELMHYYELDIKLHSSINSNTNRKRLTARDLTPKTLEVINRVAELDFKLFHYEMRNDMATDI